jgi:hypothetical protein
VVTLELAHHPRRRPEVEIYVLPDATALLFDPATEEGHALNTAAALVWEYCDGASCAEQIAAEMAALIPQSADMGPQTLQILDEFVGLGLLLDPVEQVTASASR